MARGLGLRCGKCNRTGYAYAYFDHFQGHFQGYIILCCICIWVLDTDLLDRQQARKQYSELLARWEVS